MNQRFGSGIERAGLKAIIFDVDGTLYTQAPLRRAMALRLMRHALTHPVAGSEAVRALRAFRQAQEHLRSTDCDGAVRDLQFRLACEWTGLSDDRVREIVEEWMEKAPLPLLGQCIRPGLMDALKAAKDAGIRLGVFSDYASDHKLTAMGIREYFHAVCAAQDVEIGRFKPHPKGLDVTLRRLNVAPEQALYVGDRPNVDAEAAKRAGIGAVIIGSDPAPPGATWLCVKTFRELGEMIAQA